MCNGLFWVILKTVVIIKLRISFINVELNAATTRESRRKAVGKLKSTEAIYSPKKCSVRCLPRTKF